MTVTCPYCSQPAQLVGGEVIYPHREDLYHKQFWNCAPCKAYVGCHDPNPKFGFDGTQPLGRLANAELRKAKGDAHKVFDPLWRTGKMKRTEAYAWLAKELNQPEVHIGELDVEECRAVVRAVENYHWRKQHAAQQIHNDRSHQGKNRGAGKSVPQRRA